MEFLFAFFFAAIGASVGSFVNVLSDRLPRGENVFISRSHCENCQKILGFTELMPVLSYLMLLGRCRKCKARIPIRVFFVEVLVGLVYMSLFLLFMYSVITLPFFVYLLVSIPLLLAIFFSDLVYGIIPDELVTSLVIVTGGYLVLFSSSQLINHIFTGLLSFAFFFTLFFLTKGRGMGFGDVKLSFALGLMLGFPGIIVGLYGAFLTGAAISIILILWRKKKLRGDTIPFGPFLVFSSIVSIFLGEQIFSYFLNLL